MGARLGFPEILLSFELSKSTAGHPKRITNMQSKLAWSVGKTLLQILQESFHQSGESEESGLCRKWPSK